MTDTLKPPPRRGRKPGTRFTQRPRSDHEKAKRVAIPPSLTIDPAQNKAAADAQQAARVEMLMLKGISSPRVLGTLLGIEREREVDRLIGLVHARWRITGKGRDLTRYRGEAIARLDLLTSELWSRLSDNDGSIAQRVAIIRALADIEDQRNTILGLTPRVMERLALMPNAGDGGVVGRFREQEQLARMAGRLAEIIADRRRAIDVPATVLEIVEDYEDDAEA